MRHVRGDRLDDGHGVEETGEAGGTPGKVSLTSRMHRGPSADDIADRVLQRLARGSGSPLDAGLRSRFESSLGTDLGGVRVHTGGDAADAARDAGALAFAHGQDVYFGAGQYQPDTSDGQFLIAHEVAHTVQQQGAAPAPQFALETSRAGDTHEDNADSLAAAMIAGAAAGPVLRAPVQRIARRRPDEAPAGPTLSYPGLDVVLEQIAHRIVYNYQDSDDEVLRGWGYQPSRPVELPGDLQLLCLRPLPGRRDVAPVIAFRGTSSPADGVEDFNAGGVGMFQFFRNEAAIVQKLQTLGGNVTATGHSLGGALAQIAAATHSDFVNRVVTFQAPGINPSLIESMRSTESGRRVESRHHIVDGCIVSPSGGAHTTGETFRHHRSPDERSTADMAGAGIRSDILGGAFEAHTAMPLAEEATAAGVMPTGGAFVEGGTRASFDAPTIETGDSAVGVAELGREVIGSVVGDRTESAYVAAWMHLRAQAASGQVRYSVLVAEIRTASVLADAGLQENLDQLFPELRVADGLEDRVRAGEIASADAFATAVGERTSLDETRRSRMRVYYQAILRDAGIVDRLEAALEAMVEFGAGPMMPLRKASGADDLPDDAHAIAARGAAGATTALPYGDVIQRSFGRHDVGGVSAHLGSDASAASEAIGARAYAYGNDVVFDGSPDLHTAAHEAAHVVQQRAGIHLAGGVGQAGDVHEQHADAVADRVVRGESAEALLDEYSPSGGAPAIQRTPPNVIAERPDLVCEGGEPGDLSAREHDLIRGFVARAHELIAPWQSQRQSSTLRWDDEPMRTHYRTFATNWLTDTGVQADPTRPIAFELNRAARFEARRLIDDGTFRAAVREIRAFNFSALQSYSDLLGLGPADLVMHRYRIEVVGGAQAGAGEGVGVEVQVRRYEIHYENDMGMSWTADAEAATVGAGPGLSTIPIAANLDLGGTYTGESQFYFDSEDFDWATISYLAVGGQVDDVQLAVEGLIFDNNGRRLTVYSENAGHSDRLGTDMFGSASVMVGGGLIDVTSVDRPGPVPELESRTVTPPTTGAWTPMMAVLLYFHTGEDELDEDDHATLQDLVQRMESFDDRHPGSLFRVHCQGRASRRWRGARDEAEAIERNTALASARAQIARLYMADQLVDLQAEFSTGVVEYSQFHETTTGGMSGETPDDDRQEDRAVVIAVEYNQCGPEGRADGGIRL